MEKNWKVCIKGGEIPYEPFDPKTDSEDMEYEISVIHSSDTHGLESWGWPSDTKIIFNVPEDYTKEAAEYFAKILCNGLNSADGSFRLKHSQ